MKTRMIRLLALLVFVTMLFTATGAGFAADETSTVYVKDGEHKVVDGNIITTAEYDPAARIISYGENKSSASLTVHGKIDSQYHGVEIYTEGGTITLVTDQDISALENGMSIAFSQAQKREVMTEETYNKIKDKATKTQSYGEYVDYRYVDTDNDIVYDFELYQGAFSNGSITQIYRFPGKLEAVIKGGITVAEKNNWETKGIHINDASYDSDVISIDVDGDIEATGTQTRVYGIWNHIHADTLSLEILNGGIFVDSKNGYATGIYLETDSDELDKNDNSAEIRVEKGVNATSRYTASGFTGTMKNGIMIVDFGDDVTAVSEESNATGVSIGVYGSEDGESSIASFTTEGDVTAVGGYGATAFRGDSEYYSELTAVIDGDVAAEASNGSVNGISIETRYADNKVNVEVTGDVAATLTDDENYWGETKGIGIINQGGDVAVEVGDDVTSTGTGIHTINRAVSGFEYLNQDAVEALMDKLVFEYDDGYNKRYYYYDEVTDDRYTCYVNDETGYAYGYHYYQKDYEGTTSVTVGGAVTSEGKRSVTGISAESSNGNAMTITVGEDVTAESKENNATGISASITGAEDRENTATIIVGGDVTAKGQYAATGFAGSSSNGSSLTAELGGKVSAESLNSNATGVSIGAYGSEDGESSTAIFATDGDITAVGEYAAAFTGYSDYGSELSSTVGGDVTAKAQEGSVYGISLETRHADNKVNVDVTGNVDATSTNDENYWSETKGIGIINQGGDVAVEVGGDVTSTETGIRTKNRAVSGSEYLNQDAVEALMDKLVLDYDDGYSTHYYYNDEETGDRYDCYVNDETGYAYGYHYYQKDYEGTTSVTVGGAVTSEGKRSVTGISAESSNGNAMAIAVGEDVTAESKENSATGISASITGAEDRENTATIIVGGDVTAKGQYEASGFSGSSNGSMFTAELGGKVSAESQNSEAKGVSLSAYGSEDGESSTATFATDGDITAVGGDGATAFQGYSDYGSELTATVGGDVTAKAQEGRVNGISIATKYADNKAEVEITGDINAALTGDDFWYDTYGINALNNGGNINVKTGGDVTSTGTGIYAKNQRFSETKQLTPDDFEAMKDKFKLIWEDDGEKYYTYSDQETGAYYYYYAFDDGSGYGSGAIPKDYEATTTVSVDGAVTAAGKLNTRGINVESGNGNAMDITVGEDVTAESKENSATAIRATITGKNDRANAARITVGGEVAAKGQYGATGFTGYSSSGSSLTAELGGNVDAESQESFATGVSISAYASEDSDGSKVAFTTGGDITATGKFSATGFSAGSDYGSELTATVGGGVAAVSKERSATGISAYTASEDSALKIAVGGDLTAEALTASHNETEWVEDEDGEWHEEEIEVENDAFGGSLLNYGGSIDLDVAGNIETNRNSLIVGQGYTTETTDLDEEDAKAILDKATLDYSDTWTDDEGNIHTIEGYTYTDDSGNYYYFELYDDEFDYGYEEQRVDIKAETNVTVGGDVVAENEDSYANGILLDANNKNSQVDISVEGSVQASALDGVTGLSGKTQAGSIQAFIAGEVLAESVRSSAYGLFASADGDNASGAFTVGGMVSASVEKAGEEEESLAVGVEAQIGSQGGNADVEVLEGVVAEFTETPEKAIGINVKNRPAENKEGVIAILVTGDVESTGNGVNILSASTTDKNGKPVASKEKTDIEIIGDVTAGERGLNLERAFNTDVIVDGTVSGGKGAVVLRDDTDASSLMLTVWELVPDENGAVITRYDHTATDEDVEYIEDRELEKEVQYIIHVIQPEKGATLYTEGTEEYEGYLVAHEGDTVYLIADMKPGYRITGAFYDEELTRPMTKEKYNRYFVAVPKGGAVSLSALIERALKLASLKPDYTVTYSEPNDYDEFVEKDRNGSKAERTQIRMNGNGGTVYGQENYFALARTGSTLTLPQPDVREGFTFIGWYPNALANGAAAPGEEELIGANTQVTAGEASIYSAIWKETK